ncbi:alkaline phosphatase family protein [Aporhodopirellula aestuarii]|uniref:Uncharacterized protein n=1 Tax=Aporhodopirellula aestuarii TaxID=2950107 RepID=A0ABT0U2H0_9BACT|nr:hypothetical protein [Aporhodopirellula aestuarii]MCM2371067.1 hypothetical protein [Aporhodopirellula aestuarii]
MNWCEVTIQAGAATVRFHPSPDRFWTIEHIASHPLPDWTGLNSVTLTGPGAIWMYAYAAAHAAQAGVPTIRGVLADGQTALRQFPDAPSRSGESEALTERSSEDQLIHVITQTDHGGSSITLEADLPAGRSANAADIQSAMRSAETILRNTPPWQRCYLTGRGTVEMYASQSVAAVRSSASMVIVIAPRNGHIVVHGSDGGVVPRLLPEHSPSTDRGHLIGVIGDPNCGKSVFSHVLNLYRDQAGASGWRMDCDGQAPTPPWYLSGRERQPEVFEDLRRQQKRAWTDSMETHFTSQLQSLRRHFAVVVADLPGGDHRHNPPRRIPPGRERMLREIDQFIILQRHDHQTSEYWLDALNSHQLADRTAAIVTSKEPNTAPSLRRTADTDSQHWKGIATGLDRSRSASELCLAMEPAMDTLWDHLFPSSSLGKS